MPTVVRNTRGRVLLVEHIERYGLTKSVFAEASGVSPSMLSYLLSGKRNATLLVAAGIERASEGEVPLHSWLEEAK